jgi:hypothetical protein
VLDTVAINAARLCEAADTRIRLVEGDGTRLVASFGTAPAPEFVRNTLGNPAGRAILNRETVHVNDIAEAIRSEYPDIPEMQPRLTGTRTFLSTPTSTLQLTSVLGSSWVTRGRSNRFFSTYCRMP